MVNSIFLPKKMKPSWKYITRNIDIEASANIIWENLIVEEITITNDNTLNNSLNAPFTQ